MPQMHLRQIAVLDKSGFTYSVCGPVKNKKERIQKNKETGDSRYIYQKELDRACFKHDMAYGYFKDLTRKTASDKVLRDKAHNVAKNLKDHEYQRGIAAMVYRFFDRKISGSDNKNENISNQEIAEELHTPIIKNIKSKKYTHLL